MIQGEKYRGSKGGDRRHIIIIIIIIIIKVILEQATKAQRGSIGVGLLFL